MFENLMMFCSVFYLICSFLQCLRSAKRIHAFSIWKKRVHFLCTFQLCIKSAWHMHRICINIAKEMHQQKHEHIHVSLYFSTSRLQALNIFRFNLLPTKFQVEMEFTPKFPKEVGRRIWLHLLPENCQVEINLTPTCSPQTLRLSPK